MSEQPDWCLRWADAQREIERLRAALARLLRAVEAGADTDERNVIEYEEHEYEELMEAEKQARAALAPSETGEASHVRIPTTADEAALMVLLGTDWLKQHAPERLRCAEPAKEGLPVEEWVWFWIDRMARGTCTPAEGLSVLTYHPAAPEWVHKLRPAVQQSAGQVKP